MAKISPFHSPSVRIQLGDVGNGGRLRCPHGNRHHHLIVGSGKCFGCMVYGLVLCMPLQEVVVCGRTVR